jgi:hypothetical protein
VRRESARYASPHFIIPQEPRNGSVRGGHGTQAAYSVLRMDFQRMREEERGERRRGKKCAFSLFFLSIRRSFSRAFAYHIQRLITLQ